MAINLRNKHFITTDDWSKQELDIVFDLSADLKRRFALNEPHRLLQDKTLFMMFFEQSTRTRNSMEAGMTQLGGHAHDLTPDKMQLSHGESAKDTSIILSRMGHGIATRQAFYGSGNKYLNELAKHATVPVMSLQDDVYHPMQGLADKMVINEYFGNNTKGLKVTIAWAYAKSHAKPLSVPQTQALLFPRYGMDVTVAHPKEFPLSANIIAKAKKNAEAGGGSLRFTNDMDEAIEGAHIVIPKNWGGYAAYSEEEFLANEEEAFKEMGENLEKYQDWIFDRRRVGLAHKDVKMMHALPADRGREVTDEVIDDESISIVYDEAENRLHTAKAIMALTMGGR
ncbi:MAG TPA: ornithine carbamoyltransferase [Trueperaceae bacterium]|nr:ornithine carbamoyltransferase [Trueperaceae bacterium]